MISKLLCVSLIATALGGTSPAAAQQKLIESYDAAASCPDSAWFEAEVRRRLSGAEPVSGALRVSVEQADGRFSGAIERVGASADFGKREVSHESCAQVVQALALIGALWLAPDAEAEVAPPPPAPAPSGAATPPARVAPRESRAITPNDVRFTHGPALGIAAQERVAPDLRFGPRLAYHVAWERPRHEAELRLAWTHLASERIPVAESADAKLTYDAATLRWCEGVVLFERLVVGPCLAFDLGVLRGTGDVNGVSVTRAALWASAGLTAKLAVRVAGPLFIELSSGLLYPLSRSSFHFAAPDEDPMQRPIFNVPRRLGFSGDASLGLRFR